MPAASDPAAPAPPPTPELPHTWRPFGPRIAGAAAAVALVVVAVVCWVGFDAETRAAFTTFQRLTMAFLSLLAFAAMFALVRSRVVAERERLVVINGYRRHAYSWAEIVSVSLPPGSTWVTLDLADGTSVAVMGIQGSDGVRARTAVRQLRGLVDGLTR